MKLALSTSVACPQKFVALWRIRAETYKRGTNSPATLRVRGSSSCISNTSAAVIAVRVALVLVACIKFIQGQTAAIGC